VLGSTCDGGYAEMMLARATGLVSIPDELSPEEAAPILCAGIATFNGLKASGAEAGDTGQCSESAASDTWRCNTPQDRLPHRGHRARSGHRGGCGATRRASLYRHEPRGRGRGFWSGWVAPRRFLRPSGDAEVVSSLLPGLAPGGRLVLLRIGKDPLVVSMGQIVGGERAVIGSITGSPYETSGRSISAC